MFSKNTFVIFRNCLAGQISCSAELNTKKAFYLRAGFQRNWLKTLREVICKQCHVYKCTFGSYFSNISLILSMDSCTSSFLLQVLARNYNSYYYETKPSSIDELICV